MKPALRFAVCFGVCAIITGCGGGDSEGDVSGTVTFDGQPIPRGSIVFVKTDGSVRGGGVIKDGGFQTKLQPGTYKVEVSASKSAGKRTQKGFDGKDEVIELTEEMVPEWYNKKTELTEEIKPGRNTLKLDLTQKK
ncbi:MAG: carboxypeptidase-like regulatory domain-containing protein [Planctomycetes bacterium]|nr:carboxypeptidase-like regulatory domain-containing protein [Planctomycetota bacterium]